MHDMFLCIDLECPTKYQPLQSYVGEGLNEWHQHINNLEVQSTLYIRTIFGILLYVFCGLSFGSIMISIHHEKPNT